MKIFYGRCKNCGKKFIAYSGAKKYCSKKCRPSSYKLVVKRKGHAKEQPCWSCKNACGGCSWSRAFVPIKGWDATPSIIKQKDGIFIDTYKIKYCPEFIYG